MPLKQMPRLYSDLSQYVPQRSNKLFPVLLAIKRMLHADEKWKKFARELEDLIADYTDVIRLSFMGFPQNWKSALE